MNMNERKKMFHASCHCWLLTAFQKNNNNNCAAKKKKPNKKDENAERKKEM